MPPEASSNLPYCSLVAPVKEPFSCPNSWLSTRLSGTAGRFTATNGPLRRSECSWTYLASISLPVPLSPVISTVTGLAAIFSAMAATFRMTAVWPSTIGFWSRLACSSRSQASSRADLSWSSVFATRAFSSGGEKSLVT